MKNQAVLIKSDVRSVLAFVKKLLPENPVVVEAGAFCGHDTVVISDCWQQGTVHAFEPVPQLYEQLKKRVAHKTNVFIYQCALGNVVGQAELYVAEKPETPGILSQAGSLLRPKERLKWSPLVYKQSISVQTVTLDFWAKEQAISKIDFLWFDLQGYALPVLKAAPCILKTIKIIYVEVEFVEAYEGQALYHEVREWLEQQGFSVVAVDFVDQKTWFFGNVIFVRTNDL